MTEAADGITITLDGKSVSLVYTLRAAKLVNAYFGGFVEAHRRISALDLDAFAVVVAAGTTTDAKPVKPADVESAIWRTRMNTLSEKVAMYVARLSNGGQPIEAA